MEGERRPQKEIKESPEQDSSSRDIVEQKLKEIFGDKLLPTEQAHEAIRERKDGSFAVSEMGMMLYTNGYNLRGQSKEYPNGMVYSDDEIIFGVGYFAREGEEDGHLMVVAPRGENVVQSVDEFFS